MELAQERSIGGKFPVYDLTIPSIDEVPVVIKRAFPTVPDGSFECTALGDGVTNIVVHVRFDDRVVAQGSDGADEGPPQHLLCRLYGKNTEVLIDRKQEILNHHRLYTHGYASRIYGLFYNGYIYGFTSGSPCTISDIQSPKVTRAIARHLARIHRDTEVNDHDAPHVFETLERWLSKLPEKYSRQGMQEKFEKTIHLSVAKQQIAAIKGKVDAMDCMTAFCHNDIVLGNIIVNQSEEETTVSLIDYEYGNCNYCSYDIANHFNEYAGLNLATLDYSRLPDTEQKSTWITHYLAELTGARPTEADVKKLLTEVNVFMNLSHLFWGVWSLYQAESSEIDFDYMAYAKIRFDQVALHD